MDRASARKVGRGSSRPPSIRWSRGQRRARGSQKRAKQVPPARPCRGGRGRPVTGGDPGPGGSGGGRGAGGCTGGSVAQCGAHPRLRPPPATAGARVNPRGGQRDPPGPVRTPPSPRRLGATGVMDGFKDPRALARGSLSEPTHVNQRAAGPRAPPPCRTERHSPRGTTGHPVNSDPLPWASAPSPSLLCEVTGGQGRSGEGDQARATARCPGVPERATRRTGGMRAQAPPRWPGHARQAHGNGRTAHPGEEEAEEQEEAPPSAQTFTWCRAWTWPCSCAP